jgi:RNA recognition motif-containing protein
MDTERNAQRAIEALDGYDLQGQRLEVKFSDHETAKQYPLSKYKRNRGEHSRKDEGGYSGRDRRDHHDDRRGGGFGRGGRTEKGVNRSNTYDYDRNNDRYYNKGGRKYDDYDDYDYDDEDGYYDEDDRRQGSYRRSGEKDGYKRGGYDRRDGRNDYRGEGRGGRGDYNRGGDSWRGDRNYDKHDKGKRSGDFRGRDDTSQAENEERVLYINNLNYDTTEAGLEKAFREFGTVERVAIGYRRDGRSLGNAQVQFKTKQ